MLITHLGPPCITVLATQLCCFFESMRSAILVATVNGSAFHNIFHIISPCFIAEVLEAQAGAANGFTQSRWLGESDTPHVSAASNLLKTKVKNSRSKARSVLPSRFKVLFGSVWIDLLGATWRTLLMCDRGCDKNVVAFVAQCRAMPLMLLVWGYLSFILLNLRTRATSIMRSCIHHCASWKCIEPNKEMECHRCRWIKDGCKIMR